MARFTVTVNDQAVLDEIARMRAAGGDMRPALELVADDFRGDEAEVFASQGTSIDHPWVPLSRAYLERRERRGRGGRPLTGGPLERSLTVRSARYSRRRITRTSLTVGTTDPVARLHQRGTGERWVRTRGGQPLHKPRYAGSLPARPVVFVTPQMQERARLRIREHLFGSGRGRLGL